MVRFFSIAKKRVTISTGYTIILLSAGLRLELFFVIHRSFKISRAEAESAKTSTSADVSAGTPHGPIFMMPELPKTPPMGLFYKNEFRALSL